MPWSANLPGPSAQRVTEPGALGLAASALAEDPTLLPGQIIARLLGSESPEIEHMVRAVAARRDGPWLRPLQRTLIAPGGPLRLAPVPAYASELNVDRVLGPVAKM